MFVVDASVFSSVLVKDEFYDRARNFLRRYFSTNLVTLDFALIEVANVLWKHTFVLKRIPLEVFTKLVDSIEPLIRSSTSRIYESRTILRKALVNSIELGITVYDSLYVTLALDLGYKLATFDTKLVEILESKGLRIAVVP